MTIEQLSKKLDEKITVAYAEYCDLHEELNRHRGKKLEGEDIPEVNRILKGIQDKFIELYPAFHFISFKHQMAANATNSYNDFIESLKKSGATDTKEN